MKVRFTVAIATPSVGRDDALGQDHIGLGTAPERDLAVVIALRHCRLEAGISRPVGAAAETVALETRQAEQSAPVGADLPQARGSPAPA